MLSYNLDASHCRKPFRKECVCYKVKNTNKGCKGCPTCQECTEEHSNRPVTGCYYLLEEDSVLENTSNTSEAKE